MKKNMYFTQEILFETHHFGKDYFMMKDVDGTIYMVAKGDDGLPDLS